MDDAVEPVDDGPAAAAGSRPGPSRTGVVVGAIGGVALGVLTWFVAVPAVLGEGGDVPALPAEIVAGTAPTTTGTPTDAASTQPYDGQAAERRADGAGPAAGGSGPGEVSLRDVPRDPFAPLVRESAPAAATGPTGPGGVAGPAGGAVAAGSAVPAGSAAAGSAVLAGSAVPVGSAVPAEGALGAAGSASS